MDIEYLSHVEEATLRSLVREGSELATLSALAFAGLGEDTDYDSVLVSFESDDTMRVKVNDSPYLIRFCQIEQSITLFSQCEHDLEPVEDSSHDLDEDGVETIVDIISSRPLTDEVYA